MPDFTRRYYEVWDFFDNAKWTYNRRYQRYWARFDDCQFEVEVKESGDGYEGCVVVDGEVVLESEWQKSLGNAKVMLAETIALRRRDIFLPVARKTGGVITE